MTLNFKWLIERNGQNWYEAGNASGELDGARIEGMAQESQAILEKAVAELIAEVDSIPHEN